MSPSRAATGLGAGAILLWASLASLTALSGPFPPFQTTAVAFAVGGGVIALGAALGGRLSMLRPTWASLALTVCGLFGYHALYFSALLQGHRLRPAHVVAALTGLAAATLLVSDKLGAAGSPAGALGFMLAFGCALVWSSYSVASRLLAAVPSESLAVSCLLTAALALACSLTFETWVLPPDATAWLALAGLGVGPVGAAFLLWDIGMKRGDVSLLGVLSYASPVISTVLLVVLGFAEPALSLAVACGLMVVAAVIATRW